MASSYIYTSNFVAYTDNSSMCIYIYKHYLENVNATNQHNPKKTKHMMLPLTSSLFFLYISYAVRTFIHTIISVYGEFSAAKTVWTMESMDYLFYYGLVMGVV